MRFDDILTIIYFVDLHAPYPAKLSPPNMKKNNLFNLQLSQTSRHITLHHIRDPKYKD